MIRTLVVVALVCGILIVSVFQVTLPAIKRNKAEALKKAVFDVIPGIETMKTFKALENGKLVLLEGEDEKAKKVYAGYNQAGELSGVAIEARGQGFQDVILIIYGYSPMRQSVVGMKVLESKETPGLGDKIEKDPQYRANFKDLDVTLSADGQHLEHEIQIVKPGKKKERWQIDTITGATISSKAVGRMIQKSTREKIPLIHRNLSVLKEGR